MQQLGVESWVSLRDFPPRASARRHLTKALSHLLKQGVFGHLPEKLEGLENSAFNLATRLQTMGYCNWGASMPQ
jgi:hypothetical protein